MLRGIVSQTSLTGERAPQELPSPVFEGGEEEEFLPAAAAAAVTRGSPGTIALEAYSHAKIAEVRGAVAAVL